MGADSIFCGILNELDGIQFISNTFQNARLEFELFFGCLIRKSDSF